MPKQLQFSEDARRSLKRGMDTLASAVGTTLGPKGRNVALDQKWGAPNVVHDGVTVAKEIDLEDPFENMGAQLIKEAASKTNDDTGDGTTTATLLAQSLVNEGLKNIAAGANPMVVKKGIEKGLSAIVKELNDRAEGILQLGEGTIYPVLYRLEEKKLIAARWRLAENGRQRKYYRLISKGHKALATNRHQWQMLSAAMGKVLGSAEHLLPKPQVKGATI